MMQPYVTGEADICVYNIQTEIDNYLMLESNQVIHMRSTDPTETDMMCLNHPCNITTKITPKNDLYVVFENVNETLEFTVQVDRT